MTEYLLAQPSVGSNAHGVLPIIENIDMIDRGATAATSDDKAASSYAKWQADGNSGTGASTAAWLSGAGGALVNNLGGGDPSGGRFTQLDLHGNPLRADDQYTEKHGWWGENRLATWNHAPIQSHKVAGGSSERGSLLGLY